MLLESKTITYLDVVNNIGEDKFFDAMLRWKLEGPADAFTFFPPFAEERWSELYYGRFRQAFHEWLTLEIYKSLPADDVR